MSQVKADYDDFKQRLKDTIELVEDMDLPDGAYWQMIAEMMEIEVDEVQACVIDDPAFFGWEVR